MDEAPEGQKSGASLLELVDCQRIQVTGCQFVDGTPYGIEVVRGQQVTIASCTVNESRANPIGKAAIRFRGTGSDNRVALNTLAYPQGKGLEADEESQVTQA